MFYILISIAKNSWTDLFSYGTNTLEKDKNTTFLSYEMG